MGPEWPALCFLIRGVGQEFLVGGARQQRGRGPGRSANAIIPVNRQGLSL